MKNEEILVRLNAMGISMYKQLLSQMLANPFYCGKISHELLDGKVIDGTHEKLISEDIFLKINTLDNKDNRCGVPHKKEDEHLPLKVFAKCSACSQPFTGYIVKAKGLWYYKCRTKGCKCNKSITELHKLFQQFLERLAVRPEYIEPLKAEILEVWEEINKEGWGQIKAYNDQLAEVTKKLKKIKEKYYILEEMSKETFEEFFSELSEEERKIKDQLGKINNSISNPEEVIEKALIISSKLPIIWASSNIKGKERLQKMLFPQGIVYDRENKVFRTEETNSVFDLISQLQRSSGENENGQTTPKSDLSNWVVPSGFEPEQTEPKSVVLPLHHGTKPV